MAYETTDKLWRHELGPTPVTRVRNNEDLQVVSSTTETALLEYTIPAGELDGDHGFRVSLSGFTKNNAGLGSKDYNFAVILGATTLWEGQITNANGSTIHPFTLRFEIMAKNAEDAQECFGQFFSGASTYTLVSGEGNLYELYGEAAEDGTTELLLQVTVTMATSNANIETTRRRYHIEYL